MNHSRHPRRIAWDEFVSRNRFVEESAKPGYHRARAVTSQAVKIRVRQIDLKKCKTVRHRLGRAGMASHFVERSEQSGKWGAVRGTNLGEALVCAGRSLARYGEQQPALGTKPLEQRRGSKSRLGRNIR
jgi:hypothetical protein